MSNKFIYCFLFFAYVNSQCIKSPNDPKEVSDCTVNSDQNNYCCFISPHGYTPTKRQCVSIPVKSYVGQDLYLVNNTYWDLECDLANVKPYYEEMGQCGNPEPVHAVDCWRSSTADNSCCFNTSRNTTSTNAQNLKTCVWLNTKKSGITNTTVSGTTYGLNCFSVFQSINTLLLLISFAIML